MGGPVPAGSPASGALAGAAAMAASPSIPSEAALPRAPLPLDPREARAAIPLTEADGTEPGRLVGSQRRSSQPAILRSARWPFPRSAVPSADLARDADEVEQGLVDLVGVGPDDRVRPARDDGGAGVVQQRGKPAAGGLVGQDAGLVSLDDQDRDADRGPVPPEVFQAGGDAAKHGLG